MDTCSFGVIYAKDDFPYSKYQCCVILCQLDTQNLWQKDHKFKANLGYTILNK